MFKSSITIKVGPKKQDILKVKQWIDHLKPAFEFIDGYNVRRICDGVIFSKYDGFCEYQIFCGTKYIYDITSFSNDKREVEIRVFNDTDKSFAKQMWININYLNKKYEKIKTVRFEND
jgi:hypothetical protein